MQPIDAASRLRAEVERQPFPFLFVTVSGAHLYGFPSSDSDYDLRGAHILPVQNVVGLNPGPDTIEVSEVRDERHIDLVSHDVKKFFSLLVKNNGYVLEQVFSPLVVHTTPEHQELKQIATTCITRQHRHHYVGFAATQWKLLQKEPSPRVKTLLYVYRVLLTGIHLMRTGEVEANLPRLNEEFGLDCIDDLIARKVEGSERSTLSGREIAFHEQEYARLRDELQRAYEASALPEEPSGQPALNDLLIRLRLRDQTPRS